MTSIVKRFVLPLAVAATAAVSVGSAGPASAAMYTVTLSGLIDFGKDYTGVFGAAGRDLAGLNIATALTFDTALGSVVTSPGVYDQTGGSSTPASAFLVSTRVTIDGVGFDMGGGYDERIKLSAASATPNATKGTITALSDYQEYGPFIPVPGMIGLVARQVFLGSAQATGITGTPQVGTYGGATGSASLYILRHDYNLTGNTFIQRAEAFYAPTTISFAEYVAPPTGGSGGSTGGSGSGSGGGGVGAVPEPQSWALMILGFGGAGAALRRRRVVVLAG